MFLVGGEKGDAFINFSSDDDARQAMMKSGSICGNQIKLFLSSRSEMQSVIAQARANPPTKALPTNAVNEQQQQEDNNNSKIPSANTISTILAEFQAKAAQQQQLQMQQQQQQTAPLADPTQSLLLAAMQSGANPLAVQQLLTAFADKQQFPFQLPALTNPMNQFSQPNNGWMNQQVIIYSVGYNSSMNLCFNFSSIQICFLLVHQQILLFLKPIHFLIKIPMQI